MKIVIIYKIYKCINIKYITYKILNCWLLNIFVFFRQKTQFVNFFDVSSFSEPFETKIGKNTVDQHFKNLLTIGRKMEFDNYSRCLVLQDDRPYFLEFADRRMFRGLKILLKISIEDIIGGHFLAINC